MTASILSLGDFQDLLNRFGGDLATWPTHHRTAAEALLKTSDEARDLLAAAVEVDTVLADSPHAPKGLANRIIEAALAKKPSKG